MRLDDLLLELERARGQTVTVALRLEGSWVGPGDDGGTMPLGWAKCALTLNEIQVVGDGPYTMLVLGQDMTTRFRFNTEGLEIIPFGRGIQMRVRYPVRPGMSVTHLDASLVLFFRLSLPAVPGENGEHTAGS